MTPTTPPQQPIAAAQLHACLQAALQPQQLEVLDESAQHAGHAGASAANRGTHFRVRIASQLFTGRRRVERHRLVYDAIQQFMVQGVHALAIEIID